MAPDGTGLAETASVLLALGDFLLERSAPQRVSLLVLWLPLGGVFSDLWRVSGGPGIGEALG